MSWQLFSHRCRNTALPLLQLLDTLWVNWHPSISIVLGIRTNYIILAGAAIALLDTVYLHLHLPSGTTFKTIGYGLPRVHPQISLSYKNWSVFFFRSATKLSQTTWTPIFIWHTSTTKKIPSPFYLAVFSDMSTHLVRYTSKTVASGRVAQVRTTPISSARWEMYQISLKVTGQIMTAHMVGLQWAANSSYRLNVMYNVNIICRLYCSASTMPCKIGEFYSVLSILRFPSQSLGSHSGASHDVWFSA